MKGRQSSLTLCFEQADDPVLIRTKYVASTGESFVATQSGRRNDPRTTSNLYTWGSKSIRAFAWALVSFKRDKPTGRDWTRDTTQITTPPVVKTLAEDIEHNRAATIDKIIPGDVRRIFPRGLNRTRSHRAYLPVQIAIDGNQLPHRNVNVVFNDKDVTDSAALQALAQQLLDGWLCTWPDKARPAKSPPAINPAFLRALDAPVDDFAGRIDERAKLVSALKPGEGVRIVMIHGMPGSGKTQLALVVARKISPVFPGHQFIVKLRIDSETSFSPVDALASAIRSLKGLSYELPRNEKEMRDVYLGSLSETNSLVIVDNAVDPDEVEKLVPPDGCALIVTSRERIALHRPVEARIDGLGELKPKEAEALLVSICRRLSGSVAEKICRFCGYLPLAIRAAGNLLDATVDLDPAEYATELANEHDRLDRIGQTGVPIGVEASFNLSYQRLDPKTKKAFQTLAVFPASFDSSAAAALCDDIGNSALHELVKRALVNFSEASKRYVLHDLMRLFAAKQLGTDREAAMKRFGEYYLSVLEKSESLFSGDEQSLHEGSKLFAAENVNILAAWKWCTSNYRVSDELAQLGCRFGGHRVTGFFLPSNERISLYDASVTAARSLAPSKSASEFLSSALRRLARAHYDSGINLGLSTKLCEEALQIATSIHDLPRRQAALAMLARNRMFEAGKDRRLQESALEMHLEAYRLAVELSDTHSTDWPPDLGISVEIQALGQLANAYREFGRPLDAIRYYHKEVELSRKHAKPREEALALSGLSRAYHASNEHRNLALQTAEQALQIAERVGDEKTINTIATNLGRWYRAVDPNRALGFSERSVELNRKQGNRRREGAALLDCGLSLVVLGNEVDAEETFQQAINIAREPTVADRITEGLALEQLAYVVAKADRQEAATYAEEAVTALTGTRKEFLNKKLSRKIYEWRSESSS
jgi:tetratricopeptide (TPR) repeat protein